MACAAYFVMRFGALYGNLFGMMGEVDIFQLGYGYLLSIEVIDGNDT